MSKIREAVDLLVEAVERDCPRHAAEMRESCKRLLAASMVATPPKREVKFKEETPQQRAAREEREAEARAGKKQVAFLIIRP